MVIEIKETNSRFLISCWLLLSWWSHYMDSMLISNTTWIMDWGLDWSNKGKKTKVGGFF